MPRKKVRIDNGYSGVWEGGKPWPELLIGAKEVAMFLRNHPSTAGRWLREGRLPACLDPSGRWLTTRRLIELWILERRKQQFSVPKSERPRGTGIGSAASRRTLQDFAKREMR